MAPYIRLAGGFPRDHDFPAICEIPQLRSLAAMYCAPRTRPWLTLLRHPALAQLTELRTFHHTVHFDTECLAEAARLLPQLRILHLHALSYFFSPADFFAPLMECPALTELSLHSDDVHQHVRYIGRCSTLTRLSIQAANLGYMRAEIILADLALQAQLRHLTLISVEEPPLPIAESLCAFAVLEELRVQAFTRIKDLISHLSDPLRLPTLRRLAINADLGIDPTLQVYCSVPRRAQLLPLLEVRPDLQLTLWFPSLKQVLPTINTARFSESFVTKAHALLSAEYKSLHDAMGIRVRIRPKAMVDPV